MSNESTLPPPDTSPETGVLSPGSHIGPYRIIRMIGEGGFGEVYEAQQGIPIQRRVALKLLRAGLDTREVIARFDIERQALALMDHPGIARVHDAGTTPQGRPYFVMELVDGEPLTQFCDRHRLSIRARLELFEQVCEAIQHAHGKGLIHRDLKPANILVSAQDGRPVARVIDFGVAKAMSGRLSERTRYTLEQQLIGTPLYMSPEQAEGSPDIDTRSDVYALGVILYELLTGSTPLEAIDARSVVLAEMQRLIREVDPPQPSARLAQRTIDVVTLADQRNSDPRTLGRQVSGELDWIVMKALEKDRARRYQTANGFALDVRRFLSGEAVLAAPPSARYRALKFVRRHRLWVGAASAVALALIAGITIALWQARIASQRADELQEVASFQSRILSGLDASELGSLLDAAVRERLASLPADARTNPEQAWASVDKVELASSFIEAAILAPAVTTARERFGAQPQVEATLSNALVDAFVSLGRYEPALALRQRQQELSAALGDAEDAIGAGIRIAELHRLLGDTEPAERLLVALRTRCAQALSGDHRYCRELVQELARLRHDQSRFDEAEALYREVLKTAERLDGPVHEDTGIAASDLGYLLMDAGASEEAQPFIERALEIAIAREGAESASATDSLSVLAALDMQKADYPRAESRFRDVLAARKARLGEGHPDTLRAYNDVGAALHRQGRSSEAIPLFEAALAGFRASFGEAHAQTVTAHNNLCVLMGSLQKPSEALPHCQQALAGALEVFGAGHPSAIMVANSLASVQIMLGEAAAADALLAPLAGPAREAFSGDNGIILARLLLNLARARIGTGQSDAARPLVDEVAKIFDGSPAVTKSDHEALARVQKKLEHPSAP
jgi:non-specific serine/threonine protein kinase/serine/threonine-protein kinase